MRVNFRVGKRLTPSQLETLPGDKLPCNQYTEGFEGALKGFMTLVGSE